MPKVIAFSKGKTSVSNEDHFGYNESTFIVADGATDKSGKKYKGKTGGEIISQLVVKKCLSSKKTGLSLVKELNEDVKKMYRSKNPAALRGGFYLYSSTLLCAKIKKQDLIITQVGETSFRINGKKVYTNFKLYDELVPGLRAEYIKKTGDVKNSRAFIFPLLQRRV